MVSVNFRELLPWFVLSAQTLLFFSVESWEMRAALVLAVLFQIWQKSRNYRRQQQQQPQNNQQQQVKKEGKKSKKNE